MIVSREFCPLGEVLGSTGCVPKMLETSLVFSSTSDSEKVNGLEHENARAHELVLRLHLSTSLPFLGMFMARCILHGSWQELIYRHNSQQRNLEWSATSTAGVVDVGEDGIPMATVI
ncbi:dephospho-CoA kinase [Striga asiatica]|uniref:Dephospho-CoA kinase n=1 Tax=Striga asiatica TaxID=4170 RepID=A0A5A7NYS2_STRAF|nr:dephospho-CoA kinase [Striga asiatica]